MRHKALRQCALKFLISSGLLPVPVCDGFHRSYDPRNPYRILCQSAKFIPFVPGLGKFNGLATVILIQPFYNKLIPATQLEDKIVCAHLCTFRMTFHAFLIGTLRRNGIQDLFKFCKAFVDCDKTLRFRCWYSHAVYYKKQPDIKTGYQKIQIRAAFEKTILFKGPELRMIQVNNSVPAPPIAPRYSGRREPSRWAARFRCGQYPRP